MHQNRWKLMAAVGLLLLPILLFGGLFISQSNKELRFAQKEVLGVEIAAVTMPLIADILAGNDKEFSPARSLFLSALETKVPQLNLGSAWLQFSTEIIGPKISARDKLSRLEAFLVVISDSSNLTLDPDLDSYYLMNSLMTGVPKLFGKVDDFVKALVNIVSQPNRTMSVWDYADFIAAAGQIPVLRNEMAATTAKSFNAAGPRQLREPLEKQTITMIAKLMSLYRELLQVARTETAHMSEPKKVIPPMGGLRLGLFAGLEDAQGPYGIVNNDPKTIPADDIEILRDPNSAERPLKGQIELNEQILKFSKLASNELLFLLQKRINNLTATMYRAIAISGAIALLALSIAIAFFRGTITNLDQRVLFLAHHDELTGLRNRTSFMRDTDVAIQTVTGQNQVVALHVIDIDNFKTINDTRGHPAGDKVLRRTADVLKSTLPEGASVARFGGDEFVILHTNVSGMEAVERLTSVIVNLMREGLEIDGIPVRVTVSIGTALSSQLENSAERLMQAADIALYAAKTAGRDRAVLFSEEIAAQLREEQRIENEVRRGLAEQSFTLEFQPQFDVSGKVLNGFEALLRLIGQDGNPISPEIFVPTAEKLGLIKEIGRWVLNHACNVASTWPEHLTIAVNLSPEQFEGNEVSQDIVFALDQSGLSSQRLQVEITEGILLEDTEGVLAELNKIRELGVSIAMDDFGSGYSSLSYLCRFPIDKLKVDRTFVVALGLGEKQALNVLRTIVMLGHSLGMTVTAEGVETQAQAQTLMDFKCDEIQGFLYGRPITESEVPALVLKNFIVGKELTDGKTIEDCKRYS